MAKGGFHLWNLGIDYSLVIGHWLFWYRNVEKY
jgi:hypothetical protein